MTTCIVSPHTRHNQPCASRWRALPFHAHRWTAPVPGIGTAFRLESSYANRNNRNRISYEKTFFSYEHVPTLSYDYGSPDPACPAFSSPSLPRPATDLPRNSLSVPPQSEQSPKLPQSCNRNSSNSASAPPSLDPSQPDTSPAPLPVPLPYRPEHGPKLFQSYGRNNPRPNRGSNHTGHYPRQSPVASATLCLRTPMQPGSTPLRASPALPSPTRRDTPCQCSARPKPLWLLFRNPQSCGRRPCGGSRPVLQLRVKAGGPKKMRREQGFQLRKTRKY